MDATLSFLERRPNTLDSICDPTLEYLLAFTKSARTIWKLCGLNRDHLGRIAMRLGAAIQDSMGLQAEQLLQPVLESSADHAFDRSFSSCAMKAEVWAFMVREICH